MGEDAEVQTAHRVLLSRQIIDRAAPVDKPYRIWDTKVPGLFLRVQPSGAKTFNVQWSRSSSKSIGKHPVLTLEGARTRALSILSDAAANGTPEVAKPRNKVSSLKDFIDQEYGPWATEHRKDGKNTADRIRSRFAELLSKPLAEINAWTVEKWRSARLKDGASPATVNRDLAALKAALSKALEWDFIESAPLAKVKPSKVESDGVVRYLSSQEEKSLRATLAKRDETLKAARARTIKGNRAQHSKVTALPAYGFADHLTPLVLLAMNTGMRRGEMTSLLWSDVNFQTKQLTIRGANAKSGKARHIPLNAEARDALKRWHRQDPKAERVFGVSIVKKSWASLLRDAKIKDFRFHDLRHHFASRLVMSGVDLNTVRELLGHSSLQMTTRYAHLAPEHKAAAVEKLVAR